MSSRLIKARSLMAGLAVSLAAALPGASAQEVNPQQAFLDRHAEEEGVIVRYNGLHYRPIEFGKGAFPAPNSNVVVHYEGKLIDGTVFDSSYERGKPAKFRLDQVIKGWTEGLILMREGGKAELVIPSELGYGEQGSGDDIPPGATLIFQVELLEVQ